MSGSLFNFIKVNGFILLLTLFQMQFLRKYPIMTIFCRMCLIIQFFNFFLRNKEYISNPSKRKLIDKIELVFLLLIFSFIESKFIYYLTSDFPELTNNELLLFIPYSFLFEIIFDFFHYVGHRTLHNKRFKFLGHEVHHKHQYPTIDSTVDQSISDVILTNVLPFFLALKIMNLLYPMSYFVFNLMLCYKSFNEFSGHCGKKINSSSFAQCIWLPRLFGIELRIYDHDLHHSIGNCNYSKKFKLWDLVFDTYREKRISR